MDISDKLIIVCIIFAILAILSIVFGCYYFSNKQENFKNKNSKESFIIKTITDYFKNNAEDFKIIEFMKQHKSYFKNEKFVGKVVEALTNEESLKTKKSESFKAKKGESFKTKKKN
tara:strand:+ start:147 stop:494 length:348 start_codon:yes stop_codon:yes gene_type:complete